MNGGTFRILQRTGLLTQSRNSSHCSSLNGGERRTALDEVNLAIIYDVVKKIFTTL